MTLLSRKRLMGISLITLAAFSACTDDVDGDRDTGLAGHRLSFIVDMEGEEAQTRADGSGTTAATQYFDPVELKGKQGGKSVYLQAEETDGFPGEGQPLTRGTQISTAANMTAFAVSAYTSVSGTPDHMYNVKVEKKSSEWNPDGEYIWPEGKKLSFYAWYPYGADCLNVTDQNTTGSPTLTYTVPETVEEQYDVLAAIKYNQSDGVGGTRLQFKHALSAVKFVTGDAFSTCTVRYIKLKGVKYKGSYLVGSQEWTPEDDTKDFTLQLDKDVVATPDTKITEGDQTFLMMPQSFADNENAELEVSMTVTNVGTYVFSSKLKDIFKNDWKRGKTYTCRISDNLSGDMKVDVSFYKGSGYTAHNISANGDPFTIDIDCVGGHVTGVTARLAYEYTVNGRISYSVFQNNLDLTGKTTADFTSLCMNNNGNPGWAKTTPTTFVVQVKIASLTKVTLTASAISDTPQKYQPGKDDETWYTVWRGTMYPPNYVDRNWGNNVVISRQNSGEGVYSYGHKVNGESADTSNELQNAYYEVDLNHPKYGKGKWGLPNPLSSFTENSFHKADVLYEMLNSQLPPKGNSLYGEPLKAFGYILTKRIKKRDDYGNRKIRYAWFITSAYHCKNQISYDPNLYRNYDNEGKPPKTSTGHLKLLDATYTHGQCAARMVIEN